MAKYKITVTRVDEYEIEVSDSVYNEKELANWSSVFHPVHDTEDFARSLAGTIMQVGSDYGFMEGYGYVETFSKHGSRISHWRRGEKGIEEVPEKEYASGLSVKIISENDGDYEYDVEKV